MCIYCCFGGDVLETRTVCFIGHRKIDDTPELRKNLYEIIGRLIKDGTVNFIFGDHSSFNDLCYETVTRLKENYPDIRRIHFRCNYENAGEYTMRFLMTGYEESVCPKGTEKAGRASYVKRNRAMIEASDICIFYYDENYMPPKRKPGKNYLTEYQPKSGTAQAYAYAKQKGKEIHNLF